jgi:hypothetical protein
LGRYIRELAARSLARIVEPDAVPCASYLENALSDRLATVRLWSAIALWRVNRDTNAIPVMIATLKTAPDQDGTCDTIIEILGEAGPLAQAAVPTIRAKMLGYVSKRVPPEGADVPILRAREAARQALLRIQPLASTDLDKNAP